MLTTHDLKAEGFIAIVGAGPGGTTLARLLLDAGFSVCVYERDASVDARPQGGSLDLRPDSGQRAIDKADLGAAFKGLSREEAKAFRMVSSAGEEMPGEGEETHEDAGPEIDRGDLRRMLVDSLPPETIAWDHKVEAIETLEGGRWRLNFADYPPVIADLVIGADGIGSKVRQQLTTVEPIYTGITMIAANIRRELWRGSKMSDTLGEGSVMFAGGNKTIFVQRCAHDLIILYYSMAVPMDWPKCAGFELTDAQAVMACVRETYQDWDPDVLAMLTQVQDQFQLWPTSVMPPDYRWDTKHGITMLGDASHVMPPFTGKGVNLALLDALELAEVLTSDPLMLLHDAVAVFEKRMQERTRNEIQACLHVGKYAYGIDLGFDLGDDA